MALHRPDRLARIALTIGFTLVLPAIHARAEQSDIVGPRDVLNVTVRNQPTLSGTFTIGPDGSLTFPLLGRVEVGGLVPGDVEKKLATLLADGYLKNPQLSLAVDRARIATVSVMGEVRQAGSYPLTSDMTVIEVLARAGSTTERAGTQAIIRRPRKVLAGRGAAVPDHASPPEVIRVNLTSLQIGGAAENVLLRDGDTVFVPRAESIYVVGAVKNPGTYAIQDQITVLQALALSGGLTERGSSRRLRVVRQADRGNKQVKVKPEGLLQPGDTLIVGEGIF
jgi:polysaccharide export outer membrane protein